jgi:putative transposase
LRRLVARIDKYDYKLDLDSMTLALKLHNGYEVKLKLITPRGRAEKYRGWSNYELVVRYVDEELWVSVYFKRLVKPIEPKTIMTTDLNFDNLTLAVFALNGRVIRLKRLSTSPRKILSHRIWIERIQKRYPRFWRFTKGVRNSIERHGERIKSISWDYAHKISDLITDLALRYRSVVVLEDLEKLRENAKKNSKFNKRLTLWFYKRMQFCVEYEAKERGSKIVKVNPRGTSSTCPRCGSKLVEDCYRTLKCICCGFFGDRDTVATVNLYKKLTSKYSRCGVSGVALNAPEPGENPSGVQGKRDEAMISTNINLHES